MAAVIGRSFDLDLLSKTTVRGHSEVLGVIEPLMSSGLIVRTEGAKTYYFSHDKLRQTLYEDVGESHRLALHLRVARTWKKMAANRRSCTPLSASARVATGAGEPGALGAKSEENYAWQTTLKS